MLPYYKIEDEIIEETNVVHKNIKKCTKCGVEINNDNCIKNRNICKTMS